MVNKTKGPAVLCECFGRGGRITKADQDNEKRRERAAEKRALRARHRLLMYGEDGQEREAS